MLGIGLVILAAAMKPAQIHNPLAPAAKGFIQCYQPNDAAKTCESIAKYIRKTSDNWENIAITLLDPRQPISLETKINVSVADDLVCGYIREADLNEAKIRYLGQLLSPDKAAPFLTKLASAWFTMLDRKVCTAYWQSGQNIIARGTMEGMDIAIPDQKVKWVRESDGYSVAPNPKPGVKRRR